MLHESACAHQSRDPVLASALFVTGGRAIGFQEPDLAARNPDYLAGPLLGNLWELQQSEIPTIRGLCGSYDDAMKSLDVAHCVRMMTVRTRFVDEALKSAVAKGVTQMVILGTGLSSYGFRSPEMLGDMRIFEVDLPKMLTVKRARLSATIGPNVKNVSYIAMDLRYDALEEVLRHHGCELSQRTFFILEGVSMYLPARSVELVLRTVAKHKAGSGIAFDFLFGSEDRPSAAFRIPWDNENSFLRKCGLNLVSCMAVRGERAARRYLTRGDGSQVGLREIEQALAQIAVNPEAPRSRTVWGGSVWRRSGPLRHNISEAVVP